jgi:hypothetical protein
MDRDNNLIDSEITVFVNVCATLFVTISDSLHRGTGTFDSCMRGKETLHLGSTVLLYFGAAVMQWICVYFV